MLQTAHHLRPVQRRDGQEIECPGEDVGREKGAVPDGSVLLHPHRPDSGQKSVRPRPGGSEKKGLSPGEGLPPRPHTKAGHGHFNDRQAAEEAQIDEDMPQLMEDSGLQADAQKAAGGGPEQQIQRPAEQERVTEDQRPCPDEPPHGRPSSAPAS